MSTTTAATTADSRMCLCGHSRISHGTSDTRCTMCNVRGVFGCRSFRQVGRPVIATAVEPCSTQLVQPGSIAWESDSSGGLACFFVYGEGQRIRLSIDDARVMRTVLNACLSQHDAGTFSEAAMGERL